MNDSGLWKRGFALLVLVGLIAGIALWVALWRPGIPEGKKDAVCPEFFAQTAWSPGTVAVAPFPASINWGIVFQVAQASPSAKGWETRYNATLALARKGQLEQTEQFDTLLEMLEERQQLLNFSQLQKNGKMTADETAARRTILNALQALAVWYKHPERPAKFKAANDDIRKKCEAGLEQLTSTVTQLTHHDNPVLQTEALKTLQVLQGK